MAKGDTICVSAFFINSPLLWYLQVNPFLFFNVTHAQRAFLINEKIIVPRKNITALIWDFVYSLIMEGL